MELYKALQTAELFELLNDWFDIFNSHLHTFAYPGKVMLLQSLLIYVIGFIITFLYSSSLKGTLWIMLRKAKGHIKTYDRINVKTNTSW